MTIAYKQLTESQRGHVGAAPICGGVRQPNWNGPDRSFRPGPLVRLYARFARYSFGNAVWRTRFRTAWAVADAPESRCQTCSIIWRCPVPRDSKINGIGAASVMST